MTLQEILKTIPKNEIIGNNYIIAFSKINDLKYKRPICSVSGGGRFRYNVRYLYKM